MKGGFFTKLVLAGELLVLLHFLRMARIWCQFPSLAKWARRWGYLLVGSRYGIWTGLGIIERLLRLFPWFSCLDACFAGMAWLHALGEDGELCIGVSKGDRDAFQAHAWLKQGETLLLGELPDLNRYKLLFVYSANP